MRWAVSRPGATSGRTRPRWPRPAASAAALTGAGAGAVVVGLALVAARTDVARADALLHLWTGGVALAGGLAVVTVALRRVVAERTVTTALLGAALAGYGVAGLVNASAGELPHPGTAGDVLALAVVPLLVLAFVLAPVRAPAALPVTRQLVDVALLGAAVTLTVWELVLPQRAQLGPDRALHLLVVLGVALCLVVPLQAALRGGGAATRRLAAAVAVVAATHAVVAAPGLGVTVPPLAVVTAAAVQAVVVVPAVLAVHAWSAWVPAPREVLPGADDDGGRASTATTVLAGGLLVVVLLGGGIQLLDPMALGLSVAVVVLVLAREVLLLLVQQRLVRALTRQALVDPLTGLPNAQASTLAAGSTGCAAVVVLDIVGLDAVNQAAGRSAGDALVRRVAAQLRRHAPRGATCFRLGGDEFAVLVPEQAPGAPATTPEQLRVLAGDLLTAVTRDARDLDGPDVLLRCGAALARPGRSLLAHVLEDAVAALHEAQEVRAGRPVLYDEEQLARHRRRTAVERRLPRAVAAREIAVLGQPLVDLRDGRVVGVEALARWRDPELGDVSPLEFVAAAERSGCIDDLGEQVLREAVASADAHGLLAAGVRLGVNVSPLQLRSRRLVEAVAEVLRLHRVPDGLLHLEVTESVLLDEEGPALDHLHELVAMGVRLVIDDFGAGHASLGYLRRVPANVLKIDRGLVVAAGSDVRARAVLLAGLQLCRTLRLTSVVEGVETDAVAADMARLGADLGQGWLWSRAVEMDEVARLVRLRELVLGEPAQRS